MAESSSDSSELRNYLKGLRERTGAGSPSRIPKPAQGVDSYVHESRPAHGATTANVVDSPALAVTRGGRAAALLNKVAGLGIGQRQRRKSQVREESGSPTSSPTLSNSKKEVSFKLDSDRPQKPSKIPRSPQLLKRQSGPPTIPVSPPQQGATTDGRPKAPQAKSPDVGRHQIRRSPSPYHRNCQHSLPPTSPEPQRTPSPRIKSAKIRKSPSKSASSTLTDSSTSRKESKSDSDVRGDNEDVAPVKSTAAKLHSGSVSKTITTTDSTTRTIAGKAAGAETSAGDYSDTFEESTSRAKTASSKSTRSKSLDSGLHKRTSSDGTTVPTTEGSSSFQTLKKSKSTSSASSKSTSVPDWWFPAILPPQHFGGEHLEELQKLHAGVLDDLFRFQVGLIEKHQQRADSRHKAVREFVKKQHEYTNWRAYQNDPRVQFVKWHREAGYLEAP